MERFFNHANHAGCPCVGRHLRHGVEVILRVQIGNLLLAANQVNLTVAPVAAVLSGEDVGVYRLVRPVKGAKTQMNNAWLKAVAIVLRQRRVGL